MAAKKKDNRIVDLNDVNFRNKDVVKWNTPIPTSSVPYKTNKNGLKSLHTITKIKRL